jgi:hypothetical protein
MLSRYTQSKVNGKKTKIPEIKKGTNAPSLMTFTNNKGIHPTGEVFLIMKPIVNKAVKITVLALNEFFCFK